MNALRFVLSRLMHGLLIMLGVSVLTFTMLDLAPGEFFDDLKLDASVSADTVDALRETNGLTPSPFVRYSHWLGSAARGDFGVSLAHRSPVAPLLWERTRNTLMLTVPALIITWMIALPVGLWTARNRGRLLDRACTGATSVFLAIPDLLIGLLMLLLALSTGLFPTGGMFSPGAASGGTGGGGARLLDLAMHAVLPLCAIVISTLPTILRHVRASAIDATQAPAVRAARGHGIRGWRLDLRYVLTIAANPLISLAGLSIAGLLSASLLIEVVMSWPGLGPLVVEALLARDVHVVLGASMLATMFLIAGNLLADVMLYVVDPRIRA